VASVQRIISGILNKVFSCRDSASMPRPRISTSAMLVSVCQDLSIKSSIIVSRKYAHAFKTTKCKTNHQRLAYRNLTPSSTTHAQDLLLPMLNPASFQTLGTAPDGTSAHSWNVFAKLYGVEVLVAEPSLDHIARKPPKSVQSIQRTTVVAVQSAEQQSWFAVYL
jgi:hypothetical protein